MATPRGSTSGPVPTTGSDKKARDKKPSFARGVAKAIARGHLVPLASPKQNKPLPFGATKRTPRLLGSSIMNNVGRKWQRERQLAVSERLAAAVKKGSEAAEQSFLQTVARFERYKQAEVERKARVAKETMKNQSKEEVEMADAPPEEEVHMMTSETEDVSMEDVSPEVPSWTEVPSSAAAVEVPHHADVVNGYIPPEVDEGFSQQQRDLFQELTTSLIGAIADKPVDVEPAPMACSTKKLKDSGYFSEDEHLNQSGTLPTIAPDTVVEAPNTDAPFTDIDGDQESRYTSEDEEDVDAEAPPSRAPLSECGSVALTNTPALTEDESPSELNTSPSCDRFTQGELTPTPQPDSLPSPRELPSPSVGQDPLLNSRDEFEGSAQEDPTAPGCSQEVLLAMEQCEEVLGKSDGELHDRIPLLLREMKPIASAACSGEDPREDPTKKAFLDLLLKLNELVSQLAASDDEDGLFEVSWELSALDSVRDKLAGKPVSTCHEQNSKIVEAIDAINRAAEPKPATPLAPSEEDVKEAHLPQYLRSEGASSLEEKAASPPSPKIAQDDEQETRKEPCPHIARCGFCRFGKTCDFDHDPSQVKRQPRKSAPADETIVPSASRKHARAEYEGGMEHLPDGRDRKRPHHDGANLVNRPESRDSPPAPAWVPLDTTPRNAGVPKDASATISHQPAWTPLNTAPRITNVRGHALSTPSWAPSNAAQRTTVVPEDALPSMSHRPVPDITTREEARQHIPKFSMAFFAQQNGCEDALSSSSGSTRDSTPESDDVVEADRSAVANQPSAVKPREFGSFRELINSTSQPMRKQQQDKNFDVAGTATVSGRSYSSFRDLIDSKMKENNGTTPVQYSSSQSSGQTSVGGGYTDSRNRAGRIGQNQARWNFYHQGNNQKVRSATPQRGHHQDHHNTAYEGTHQSKGANLNGFGRSILAGQHHGRKRDASQSVEQDDESQTSGRGAHQSRATKKPRNQRNVYNSKIKR